MIVKDEAYWQRRAAEGLASFTKRVLGHTFRPMTKEDREGLAGAAADDFICYTDDLTLILTACGSIISIDANGSEVEYIPTINN